MVSPLFDRIRARQRSHLALLRIIGLATWSRSRRLTSAVSMVLLAACATPPPAPPSVLPTPTTPAPAPATSKAAMAGSDAGTNYRLASGDAIRVAVYQNPDMTLETRVSEDGSINYPLVGAIAVGGLQIGSAEAKIAKALKDGGFIKQPQVNISLLTIRGNKISVLGQVNRPGSYPLETFNTRISQMLAEAGGLAPGGADSIIVTGTRDGKPFRREIDIDALYRKDLTDLDIAVAGGDTIYVPRAPTFYIYGEIAHPGTYRIDRNMTMRQALAAGGGLTARGTERRLRVVRRNADGVPEKTSADLNDLVSPDDVIYVNESIF